MVYKCILKQNTNYEQDRLKKGNITHLMTVESILNMGDFDTPVFWNGIL